MASACPDAAFTFKGNAFVGPREIKSPSPRRVEPMLCHRLDAVRLEPRCYDLRVVSHPLLNQVPSSSSGRSHFFARHAKHIPSSVSIVVSFSHSLHFFCSFKIVSPASNMALIVCWLGQRIRSKSPSLSNFVLVDVRLLLSCRFP